LFAFDIKPKQKTLLDVSRAVPASVFPLLPHTHSLSTARSHRFVEQSSWLKHMEALV
jgi:hypothetical protein